MSARGFANFFHNPQNLGNLIGSIENIELMENVR
jgi:hypothetical protein